MHKEMQPHVIWHNGFVSLYRHEHTHPHTQSDMKSQENREAHEIQEGSNRGQLDVVVDAWRRFTNLIQEASSVHQVSRARFFRSYGEVKFSASSVKRYAWNGFYRAWGNTESKLLFILLITDFFLCLFPWLSSYLTQTNGLCIASSASRLAFIISRTNFSVQRVHEFSSIKHFRHFSRILVEKHLKRQETVKLSTEMQNYEKKIQGLSSHHGRVFFNMFSPTQNSVTIMIQRRIKIEKKLKPNCKFYLEKMFGISVVYRHFQGRNGSLPHLCSLSNNHCW